MQYLLEATTLVASSFFRLLELESPQPDTSVGRTVREVACEVPPPWVDR